MKNIILKYTTALWLALTVFASATLVGCINDYAPGGADGSQEGMLTLSLLTSEPVARAAESTPSSAADDPFNEYLIDNVSLYLFKGKSANLDEDSAEPFYSVENIDIPNATTTSTVDVRIPLSKLDADAKAGNFCIYALANLSSEEQAAVAALSSKTVSALKAVAVGSSFEQVNVVEDAFVMDGLSDDISVGAATNSLTGRIELTRSSAKISLNLAVPDKIEVEEGNSTVVYTSVKNDIAVWFCNGVKISPVYADPTARGFQTLSDSRFNSADLDAVTFETVGSASAEYPLSARMPFYSYPNNWKGSAGNSNRTYMILGVPWTKEGETTPQNYYYQVPVNIEKSDGSNVATADMLERNKHYHVNLKVSKLGSPSKETPSEVDEKDLHYVIMDWNREGFNVDLDKLRYLQVERNEYVMENSTDLSIPYVTSHDVEIVEAKLMYYDYSGTNGTPEPHYISLGNGNESVNYYNTTTPIYSLKINQADKTIDFSHIMWAVNALNNNDTRFEIKTFDNENQEAIGEFVLTFTIRHKDEPTVLEQITVTQYPALYIMVENSPNRNRVFVNNGQNTANSWDIVYDFRSTNTNTNFNNYIINVTRFKTSDYVIADTRSKTINNVFSSASSSSESSNVLNEDNTINTTNQRGLSYYYPTDDSENYKEAIAPIIVVASSRGVCYNISKAQALNRCASYQENGRPAGRWRVPTFGEVKFIMELSGKKFIPRLFGYPNTTNGNTSNYWTASGVVKVGNGNNYTVAESLGVSEAPVRCVYDEWYWGDSRIPEGQRTTFAWGDRARK